MLVEVESCSWDYQTVLSRDGKDIKVSFCPIPPSEVQEDIFTASTNVAMTDNQDTVKPAKDSSEKPKFGSQPRFDSPNFNFQKELDRLPFLTQSGES